MEQNLQQTILLLARTPTALNAFLRDLPEMWTHRNEGGNTWNVYEVVAHLIYGELAQLLDEFARARSESLDQLRALDLQPQDLERRGRHPAFGPVNLSQHLATWAAHDLTHLHQISRIMAHQYREAVGPWRDYLGVLKCAGHSSP